jgi:PhnB protein
MEPIIPYVHFDGNCSEALQFYEKAMEGKIIMQATYGDAPMEMPKEGKNKIMHARFEAGSLTLLASDMPPGHAIKLGNNTSLSMNFTQVDQMEKVFNALSEGATIRMPLQDTFWGARFGMMTDKYGVNWMFNHDYPKQEK